MWEIEKGHIVRCSEDSVADFFQLIVTDIYPRLQMYSY